MPIADLPPQLQERVVCSISAAAKYEVPANLILAIAQKEAGKPGQWVRNSNGTSDVGTMQFNTAYLSTLARYGITADDVAQSGCYPYDLAAWRIRGHLKHDAGDFWTRAANYHSRTPVYNAVYRADLMVRAARWADWLQARYATYDMLNPASGAKAVASRAAAVAAQSASAAATPRIDTSDSRPIQTASWLPQSNSGYVPRGVTISQADRK
jgi:hypothetical protein